jgi:rubredoxin
VKCLPSIFVLSENFDKNVGANEETHGSCPFCQFSFDGEDIPEEHWDVYGGPPHKFSKLIGIEDPTIYDGISWWQCPNCKKVWDRFTGILVDLEGSAR